MTQVYCSRQCFLFGLTFLLTLVSPAWGEEFGGHSYEMAKAATVEILVNGHLDGSGWIADPQGLVLTAGHVIKSPGQKLEISSSSLGRKEAKVVAVDLGHDLALLSIEPRKEGYPALKLAEKCPSPGTMVFAIGAPLYRHGVLMPGRIASAETAFEYYADRFNEVTLISAMAPGGMSGGPWLNMAGEVVGVQSAVMSLTNIPVGISFAGPLPAIRTLLERRKTAATPSLGLHGEELWMHERKTMDRYPPKTEGLVIRSLQADGPASRAGLKKFDLIVAADGKPVRLIAELLRIVCNKKPGQSVELSILRPDGAGQVKATVTLGKLEVAWP